MSNRPQDRTRDDGVEAAADWFARRDAGPLSSAEEAAFAHWLDSAPAHRAAYAEIERSWSAFDDLPTVSRPRLPSPRIEQPSGTGAATVRRNAGLRPWAAAAIAAGLLVIAFLGSGLPERFTADEAAAVGEVRTLHLPDGTTVWLNTDTAISFEFDAAARNLNLLHGEAAFEVAADPERPFRVQAEGGTGTALGTVYAVRTLDGGAMVTVAEGRVSVAAGTGQPDGSAILAAGEQVHYSAATGLGPVIAVDPATALAWRRGKLVFENRPLGEVIDELNRYHAGTIQILQDGLRDRPVNGVFETGDPVATVDVLERSLGLSSTRLTDWLILLHR